MDGGIGIVEVLHSTNLLALVGGGVSPCFSPKKLIIWDDAEEKRKAELTFKTEVQSLRIKND